MLVSQGPAPSSAAELVIELNKQVIYTADIVPTIWWIALVLGTCFNLVLLAARLMKLPQEPYPRKMTLCACVFVFGCGVRSVWPRVDVERICFWDSAISVTLVGRILATAAEICFAGQISMTIGVLAQEVGFRRTRRVGDIIFWAICVAQCCCWMGVTTQRQIWHGIEESIWAVTFTAVAVCFALLHKANRQIFLAGRTSHCCLGVCEKGDAGYVQRCLTFGIPISLAYVMFMVLIDIPMYLQRYRSDQANGAQYMWVSEGIVDAMACKKISKSMEDWREEMPWMTGYFLGCTLVSLWLTWGPRFHLKSA